MLIGVPLTDRGDERHHPAHLLGCADLRPGACLDPSDIDGVGAVGDGAGHGRQRNLVVEIAPCVEEGVGRAVDDRHQPRIARAKRSAP